MNSALELKKPVIRTAEAADRDGIWTVFLTSVLELCGTHYEREEVLAWAKSLEPEAFVSSINTARTLVAEDEGRIVAFGQFNPGQGEVEALYVAPDFTGRGLGRTLLRMFEAEALERGIGWMQSGSTLNAVGFFEKEGYKQARMEQLRLPDGTTLPRIRMSKSFPEKG
jgi:GNAT superfamily N-acetyltransferase